MQFNLASLLQEPTGASREHDIDEDLQIDGTTRRVDGHVRFDRTPRGVLVRTDLHGTMDDVCSRCAKPISYPVDMEIAEEYVPTINIVTGAAIEAIEGEEDAYRIDAQHQINLGDAVRQYWSVALPMAPLCDEACRGLCPVCGDDISSSGHTCTGDEVDTRWAALAKLELG